jgi:hypothetical protein
MSNNTQSSTELNYEIPFDVIPLPSKGLLYPGQQPTVKVSYLVASDENVLTSPNLIKSGKVIDVLIERKVRDLPISYGDLLIGDRNAIMIWLRATGYGEMYNVKLMDPVTAEEFETEINLNELKIKELTVEPDENSEFSFFLPKSQKNIKFRLLTVKDEENINKKNEARNKKVKSPISNLLTYRLESQITEVEGVRDMNKISQFIQNMPAFDSLKFREYSDSIEPGIDLEVEVEGPSGEPFQTYITIGPTFFWPNARV